jgi:LacI family transcriptional regulator
MVTIADVAKLAGFSTGTVSRVMNGSKNVSKEARLKVNHAIQTLGYKPNLQARSLRSKRTDTIALAIPELTNDFWTSIARGVQDVCQPKGYHVLICNTGAKYGNYRPYLELMVNRVDGMILSRRSERSVATPTRTDSAQQSDSSREKPVVFVGQSQAANWNVDSVYSDSIAGAFALTKHLIHLGHQKIAIITGRQTSTSASNRVAGYCMALADAKIPIDSQMICWGEYSRKTSERLTEGLIKQLPQTTAIVAANNEIAIGVINALEKLDLPVPQSIAVVCFDDFYPDSRFASLMTVASQSPYDIGLNAAQLLVNRLNGNDYLRAQTIMLPPRLIIRRSCGGNPSPIIEQDTFDNVQGQLILPLPQPKLLALATEINPILQLTTSISDEPQRHANNVLVNVPKQMLRRKTFDFSSVSHFEYAITSRALYQYVLERQPNYEMIGKSQHITIEDQIEFARRSNMMMIPCRFPYQPILSQFDRSWTKDSGLPLFDVPSLSDQLDLFDRYVRVARSTNVRIVGDFRGIFADTLRTYKILDSLDQDVSNKLLQQVADELLAYQTKVVQLVCDRFATDLAFVVFSDNLADKNGLRIPLDDFEAVFSERIQRLIHPAKEHGLLTVLHTDGKVETSIPLIQQLGFDAVYIAQPELCDLVALKEMGNGMLSFMGGIPVSTLINGTSPDHIQTLNSLFSSNGGYVAGVSGEITDDVPIENYLSFLDALSNGEN